MWRSKRHNSESCVTGDNNATLLVTPSLNQLADGKCLPKNNFPADESWQNVFGYRQGYRIFWNIDKGSSIVLTLDSPAGQVLGRIGWVFVLVHKYSNNLLLLDGYDRNRLNKKCEYALRDDEADQFHSR